MSEPYVGEIRIFGGNFAPVGWEMCHGQLLSISDNDDLFNLIGTTYGGDGETTFAVPNLAGRFPMHAGSGTQLGYMGGAESVTLTQAQLPSHTHEVIATAGPSTSTSPSGNSFAASTTPVYSTDSQEPRVAMLATSTDTTGQSLPHENMPPYLAVNFIISLYGSYPSQA